MTKDEFLALPSNERKRLASVRTLERNKAKRSGQPVPPTLGEEYGTTPKKEPKPQPVAKAPSAPAAAKVERQKPVPGSVQSPSFHQVVTPRGMAKSPYRRILGEMYHCVNLRGEEAEYEAEAAENGCTHKISYFDSDRRVGVLFFKEMTEKQQSRLRAVLLGSQPELKLVWGDKEAISVGKK